VSGKQSWLIPKGADGGEFKYQIEALKAIATPVDDAMKAAREIGEERAKAQFKTLAITEKTGADDVTEAVNHFLDKWCHGLSTIVEDADVIVTALTAAINDFLVADTKVGYEILMAGREEQYKADHPVSTWLENHGITGKQEHFQELDSKSQG